MPQLNNEQPGYFEFRHGGPDRGGSRIFFNCPCGCKYPDSVPIRTKDQPRVWPVDWIWNGNEKLPTLAPSLRRHTACGFHGWLTDGAWRAENDGAPLAANIYQGVP
jgi:hypothetical protein